jgi:hypothetical protein
MPEKIMRVATIFLAAVLAVPAFAADGGPFTVRGTGKSYWRLDQAVRAIGNGDGAIDIAAGRYRDCAIQEGGRVAYVAAQPGAVIFDGAACEGKATLVLRGRAAHVQGITFEHVAVADGNGAGIRLERGNLDAIDDHFIDSQSGILSADDPSSSIRVDRSTFSGLGACPSGGCAHSIYIGNYGSLSVTNSRFERGTGGHYVKSRSPRIQVLDSSFDDSHGQSTNYMIDLSGGAVGRIAGNTFVQGPNKENHSAFITVAAEGVANPSRGLIVENNTGSMAPGVPWPSVFVADWSHEPLVIRNNKLGKGLTVTEQR